MLSFFECFIIIGVICNEFTWTPLTMDHLNEIHLTCFPTGISLILQGVVFSKLRCVLFDVVNIALHFVSCIQHGVVLCLCVQLWVFHHSVISIEIHLTCFPTGIPLTPQGVEPGNVSAALARYSRDTWKCLVLKHCKVHARYSRFKSLLGACINPWDKVALE